jgi:hypothetical protein
MPEWRYSFTIPALNGGELSVSRPGRFTPGDRAPVTDWIGSWLGPIAGLDAEECRTIFAPSENQRSNVKTIVPGLAIFYIRHGVII